MTIEYTYVYSRVLTRLVEYIHNTPTLAITDGQNPALSVSIASSGVENGASPRQGVDQSPFCPFCRGTLSLTEWIIQQPDMPRPV